LVNSKPLPEVALKKYKKEQEFPVVDNLKDNYSKIIRSDFLSKKETKNIPSDILKRSLIRHDPNKLARIILSL
jgi:hypothetical protein